MTGWLRALVVALTAAGTAALGGADAGASIAGCPVFPDDHALDTRIDSLPVHPLSGAYIASIGADTTLHPDFGAAIIGGAPIGIPFNLVPGTQPPVPIDFTAFGGESSSRPP